MTLQALQSGLGRARYLIQDRPEVNHPSKIAVFRPSLGTFRRFNHLSYGDARLVGKVIVMLSARQEILEDASCYAARAARTAPQSGSSYSDTIKGSHQIARSIVRTIAKRKTRCRKPTATPSLTSGHFEAVTARNMACPYCHERGARTPAPPTPEHGADRCGR